MIKVTNLNERPAEYPSRKKAFFETEVLRFAEPFLRAPLTPAIKGQLCATITALIQGYIEAGEVPAGTTSNVGLLQKVDDPTSICFWFSDDLQLWLWGEVKTRNIEDNGYVVVWERNPSLKQEVEKPKAFGEEPIYVLMFRGSNLEPKEHFAWVRNKEMATAWRDESQRERAVLILGAGGTCELMK